jgi:hypothetical protein
MFLNTLRTLSRASTRRTLSTTTASSADYVPQSESFNGMYNKLEKEKKVKNRRKKKKKERKLTFVVTSFFSTSIVYL